MKYLFFVATLFTGFLCAQSVSDVRSLVYQPDQEPREHPVNMLHLKLDVSFKPEAGEVTGTVTHIFAPLRDQVDSIFLDAPGININSVLRNGKSQNFRIDAKGVYVYLNPPAMHSKKDSFSITYDCKPRKGIYFIGWNDSSNRSRKQIWTQGQGIDNRYWIPMYDEMNDKVITETRITFESGWQVLSNGNLLSEKKNNNGSTTWHYRMDYPHAPYLLMIGIGKYDIEMRKTRAGTPVALWYYPEFPEKREPTYRYSTECIDFMEAQTGIPYPWKTYANIPVQDFLYGAMENTTATIFGDFILVDEREFIDRNYIGTNVHELTHQWFGDYITARSSKDTWLQESYATFYPKRFLKGIYGEDYYQWQLRGEQNSALRASEKDLLPIVHSKAGSSRWYPKGSAVIDMMHYVFGEDAMKRVIHHYLKKHAYGNVETNDLYQSFQDTLGLSPMWFFEQWLYRGGEPHYQVEWEAVETSVGKATEIRISQIQNISMLEGLFKMPIVLEVHYTDGSKHSHTEWISNALHAVRISNPEQKQVAFVLFDPGSNILKKVTFSKSFEELKSQATSATHFIDRYDAIASMKSLPLSIKAEFLKSRYAAETFHALKTEILSQLQAESSAQALRLQALKDAKAEVRLAALQSTASISSTDLPAYEVLLKDSSYNIVHAALSRLCADFPEHRNRYLEMTRSEKGPGLKIRILWLELQAAQGNTEVLSELSDYCSSSFEFITRQNAMAAIKRLNHMDTALAAHLLEAVMHPNYKLAGNAAATLKSFMEQNQWKFMLESEIEKEKSKSALHREVIGKYL
jgi:aminopeptidase N